MCAFFLLPLPSLDIPHMLQNIRKNSQGTIAKVIVFLIVASFATFGVQSILVGSGNVDVAEVDGLAISATDLQQAINIQKRRLLSVFGDRIDPAMLEDQMLRGPAMDGLVQQLVYLNEAASIGVNVGDDAVKLGIMDMPQFSENGIFSPVLYQNVLSTNGYSPALFHKLLKEEQIIGQLRAGIANTEFLTDLELRQTARVSQEARDVRYLTIDTDAFRQAVSPDPDEIEAFYQANLDRFMTLESVELEYIEINTSDFYPEVDEQALVDEYEIRLASYEGGQERRVSHILIEAGDEGRERIADIRSKALAGEDFASLAKAYSDDKSSAQSGGDLGFTAGDIFPDEMEQVIKSLQLNAISDPVKTDAGWHLLQVTDIIESSAPTLAALRAELLAEIQQREARTSIVSTVEALKDLVFNAEGLTEPAAELDLAVEQSGSIYRLGNEGLLANPSLVKAAFSDEVLIQGHNSEVIELSDDQFVVMRVSSHSESVPKSVASVTAEIEQELTVAAAMAAAKSKAIEIIEALRGGSSVETQALANGYEWQVELGVSRQSEALAPRFMSKVFALQTPDDSLSIYDYVVLSGGDIVVFELDRVTEGSINNMADGRIKQLAQQINQELSRSTDRHYQQALRARAEVKVL
jgi:peptidyl-prolyl cis-trans isomerase D